MLGLVDTKSLLFRARRSTGSKSSVIAVTGQPKSGVFTRCHDCDSLVVKSQLSAPPGIGPWAGGGMRFLPASRDPSGRLLWSLPLTWALLFPTHLHCLVPGSCSCVCYLCMKCPAKLPSCLGCPLLQPARWPGKRWQRWAVGLLWISEGTSSFVSEFKFHPKFSRRSEESVRSGFALPRSSLTMTVHSLCKS